MHLADALAHKDIPPEVRQTLSLVEVPYRGFDDAGHTGHLVVHRALVEEVRAIFAEIAAAQFPIARMVPVVAYEWSDDASMAANNSSAFNYRLAVGKTRLSQHAYGRAIDINPLQNPYIKGSLVLPPGAVYNLSARGTLLADGPVVAAFESRGWTWGGRWTTLLDYHHFEKPELA